MKVGDVVKLKSGSPKMTVGYTNEDGSIISVTWFEVVYPGYNNNVSIDGGTSFLEPTYGSLRTDTFKPDVLELVK